MRPAYARTGPNRLDLAMGAGLFFGMDDTHLVTCPYCGEEIEIYVELDVRGSYVQDCEVCCNPWTVRVSREDGETYVEVGRADGSE